MFDSQTLFFVYNRIQQEAVNTIADAQTSSEMKRQKSKCASDTIYFFILALADCFFSSFFLTSLQDDSTSAKQRNKSTHEIENKNEINTNTHLQTMPIWSLFPLRQCTHVGNTHPTRHYRHLEVASTACSQCWLQRANMPREIRPKHSGPSTMLVSTASRQC